MQPQQDSTRMFGMLSPTRLFFRCAVPSMISMAFTSLYTIADGVFVGRYYGAGALAAVNLVMPLVMISFALSDMIGVGASVQIAMRLGEGRDKEASRIFSLASGMLLLLSVGIGLIGWLLARPLVTLLGATGELADMAAAYMRVYALFSPLILCFFAVDNFLRICGRVRYSMAVNIAVSVANILLDALFIAVFRWGIASAALASCLCLAAGSLICFWPFIRGRLPLRFVKSRPSLRVLGNIAANGSSEFFSNIASSVCMMLFNDVLLGISGYLAVAAFSIVMYVDSIVKSMLFGMADSVQPAISYNFGAGQAKRVFALERRAQAAALLVSAAAMAAMLWGGPHLIALFTAPGENELLALSTRAMQLFALSYLVSWCGSVSGSFFTALNRPVYSLLLSLCATLVFPLLGLSFLPRLLGLDGVWLSASLSGALTLLLAAAFLLPVTRAAKRSCQQKAA